MDLTIFLAQLFSLLRVRKMFFDFWALLLKMYIFEVATFFSCLVFIQSTQFFSGSTYKIRVFDVNYQNAYDHQIFQGGDMLPLWGHVANKIISLSAEDVSIPH